MTAVQDRPDVHTGSTSRDRMLTAAAAALALSAVVQLADELFAPPTLEVVDEWWFRAASLVPIIAFSLLLACIGVLHRRRWAGTGRGSLAVVVLLWIGCVQAVCAFWADAFVTPVLADVAPELVHAEPGTYGAALGVALATFAVGWLAMGIAALRGKRVSRRTGWLLVAGGLAMAVVPGGQLVVGLALLSGRHDDQG